MAWRKAPYQATEQTARETEQGPALFLAGPFYCQYGACTAITASAAETSILAGAPTKTTLKGALYDGWTSTLALQGGYRQASGVVSHACFNIGTHFGGDFYGIIDTNGAGITLQLRLGLVGGATATTFNLLSDNAALALASLGAGSYFHVFFRSVVTASALGALGSMLSFIGYEYGTTAAGSATTKVVPAPQALATFNLNLDYAFDIRATFGAAHANNALQIQYGQVWMMG